MSRFPERTLQTICDDSWRSGGKCPELSEPRWKRGEFSGHPEQVLEPSKLDAVNERNLFHAGYLMVT